MKKEEEELSKNTVEKEKSIKKDPTLADRIPISAELTKSLKFKNLFKQTDTSLNLLNHTLVSMLIAAFVESVFVIKYMPLNFSLIILMLGLIIPFKYENIKTSAWRTLYVIVPVTVLGLLLNYFVFGLQSLILATMLLFAITFITSVIQILILIISRKFKKYAFNFLVYGMSSGISFLIYLFLLSI